MNLLFTLITVQAVMGAFDNLWHHEIKERLPAKRAAASETALHAVREFLYALIFFALAWYEWRGAWALLLAAVILAEIPITLGDFVVEDRTRRLPVLERVLHTVLAINLGLILAVLAPIVFEWWRSATAVVPADHGAFSWLFTLFSVGVFAWSVRNTLAVLRHRRPPEWVRDPIVAGEKSAAARTVLISGATGFIGGHLVRRLVAHGDTVLVYTRDADRALDRFGPHVHVVTQLDAIEPTARIDAIVNLAGERILGFPWTRSRRQTLIDSRVKTTRALVELAARLERAPRVFVSASAIGFYGIRGEQRLDEQSPPQPIFQSVLCQQWEEAALAAEAIGARVVRLRIGLVLGRDGGALPSLALPVRLGLGAVLGSGKQWVSWIHIDDLTRLIEFALDRPAVRGAVNAVAPSPATHRQVQHTIARALRRPMWLRVPALVVRVALGEMAQLLVDGQRVVPRRALALGFVFRHPDLRAALDHLIGSRARAADAELTEMYYNGECPVCNAEMTHYARLCAESQKSLRFIDSMQRPDALAACGLRTDHLERRVYLKDSKGRIVSGLPALIELWSRMPRYRWLAKLTSLPVLHRISVAIYDHVIGPGLAAWSRVRLARQQRAAINPS
ncbi:MAG TPA: TIGR01777 family oxidoreductase [Steroidobacteraceae bacterium]|nr:TIGR01777 family oxidoreductase [Steroidobacteraceae bacterium]